MSAIGRRQKSSLGVQIGLLAVVVTSTPSRRHCDFSHSSHFIEEFQTITIRIIIHHFLASQRPLPREPAPPAFVVRSPPSGPPCLLSPCASRTPRACHPSARPLFSP